MKIVYIAPQIANFGGLARVLSIKLNHLASLGYDIHLLTQNKGESNPIYDNFESKVTQHDMLLEGNALAFLLRYKRFVNQKVKEINPDVIVVCDNGLKAYLLPFLLKASIPLFFESHGSKYIQENELHPTFFNKMTQRLLVKVKDFGIKRYTKLILLTPAIVKDWEHKDIVVIPNPIWFYPENPAPLQAKRAIAVGRHSYEKGFDRMLPIWKKIITKHPEWVLDIYGEPNGTVDLQSLITSLELEANVNLKGFVLEMEEKYLEYSICLMTSRSEGFPMFVLEAMASGLPVVAYDCSGGIQGMLSDVYNGFLVEAGDEARVADRIGQLITDKDLRKELGKNARESVKMLTIEMIMKEWEQLFQSTCRQK